MGGDLSVVALDVEGHLGRPRLNDAQGGIVVAGRPVARPDARPDEALPEGEVIGRGAGPRRQQHAVRAVLGHAGLGVDRLFAAPPLFGRQGAAAEEDSPGHRDVDVGRPEVGVGLVGVQVLRGRRRARVAVCHQRRLAPVQEIFRSRPRGRPLAADHVAGVQDVLLLDLGPEHHVLRVEVVAHHVRDDQLLAQLAPVDTVAGDVREQTDVLRGRIPEGVGLVALRVGHAGARIPERAELRGLDEADHVVARRAVDLEDAEIGLAPHDPVGALRVAGQRPLHVRAAPVVHAVDAAVLQDGRVERAGVVGVSLDGGIVLDRDAARPGLLQLEPSAFEAVDKQPVDEQLTA